MHNYICHRSTCTYLAYITEQDRKYRNRHLLNKEGRHILFPLEISSFVFLVNSIYVGNNVWHFFHEKRVIVWWSHISINTDYFLWNSEETFHFQFPNIWLTLYKTKTDGKMRSACHGDQHVYNHTYIITLKNGKTVVFIKLF